MSVCVYIRLHKGVWGLHCTIAGCSTSVRNKLCLMKSGRLPKRCPPSPQVIITRPPSAFPLFSSLLLFLLILIFCLPPSFSLFPSHFFFSFPAPALSSFCQEGIGSVTLSSGTSPFSPCYLYRVTCSLNAPALIYYLKNSSKNKTMFFFFFKKTISIGILQHLSIPRKGFTV